MSLKLYRVHLHHPNTWDWLPHVLAEQELKVGLPKPSSAPGHRLLHPGKAADPGTTDKPLSFGSEMLAGRRMQPRILCPRGTLPATPGLSHSHSHPHLCQGSPCSAATAGAAAGAERGRLSLAGMAAAGRGGRRDVQPAPGLRLGCQGAFWPGWNYTLLQLLQSRG